MISRIIIDIMDNVYITCNMSVGRGIMHIKTVTARTAQRTQITQQIYNDTGPDYTPH